MSRPNKPLVRLLVRNHAGVMSHITGLFSRRGFNIEGIMVGRLPEQERSMVYLLLEEEQRLDQILAQLDNLQDVLETAFCHDGDPDLFARIPQLVEEGGCHHFVT